MSCGNFAAGVFIKGDDVGGLVSDCVAVDVNVFCLHKMFFYIPKGSDTKFLKVIFSEIWKVEFCNVIKYKFVSIGWCYVCRDVDRYKNVSPLLLRLQHHGEIYGIDENEFCI